MSDALEKRFVELDELASQYGEAEGQRTQLENYKSVIKSKLMKEAERRGVTSISAQEREAYTHPDYLAFVMGLAAATSKAEELKWQLKNAHLKAEIYRTQQATRRAEMSLR